MIFTYAMNFWDLVAIEKGAFCLPSTVVANFTFILCTTEFLGLINLMFLLDWDYYNYV